MPDDITNGELARRIDAVLAELRRIEDRYTSKESHEALKDRVTELEDRGKFMARLAWSGVIVPFLLAVLLLVTIKGGP